MWGLLKNPPEAGNFRKIINCDTFSLYEPTLDFSKFSGRLPAPRSLNLQDSQYIPYSARIPDFDVLFRQVPQTPPHPRGVAKNLYSGNPSNLSPMSVEGLPVD